MFESKPLQGTTLLSLAINIPGPVAAARLRDLGAHVTKVEPPSGDPLRHIATGLYEQVTRGMDVLTLDLKALEDRRRLDQMLATTDVLLTASRPTALARLELDWETLHERFPRLCTISIVGHAPPRENVAGHDLTYQAKLGTLSPPAVPRVLLADMAGAERAVSAALALLLARERGGPAGYAVVPLEEAAAEFSVTVEHGITTEGGVLGGGLPNYSIYRTREGWLAVAALEPHFYERLLVEFGLISADHAQLAEIFLQRTAREWEDWAAARDIPLAEIF